MEMQRVLAELAEQLRTRWPVPGIAISVVDGAGESASVTAGFANAESKAPISRRTRFEIGSVSKTFTSVLLGILADEGKVDLDAPVADYLPWFAPNGGSRAITVRHLLQHTSGLVAGADALPDAAARGYALRNAMTWAEPGELFHYSNEGYNLLGLIVEKVTGEPLADAMAGRLLRPLGMRDSAARIVPEDIAELATGYRFLHEDRPPLPAAPLAPAGFFAYSSADGNVLATASDLGRFARMLLGRGTLDGTAVIRPERLRELLTVPGDTSGSGSDSGADSGSGYACGVDVEVVDGRTWLTHAGGMVGYRSYLAVDTDGGHGVAVLTNAPGECQIIDRFARHVLDVVQGAPADPALFDPERIPDARRYVGTHGTAQRRIVVETAGDDRLTLTADGETGRLYDTGDGRLVCDHPGWSAYHHSWDGRWLYGPESLGPAPAAPAVAPHPLEGRYRSYTPWYPAFGIVQRAGRLHMIAATGVEAPCDEPELVRLDDGTYRVGADPRLPERLVPGPVLDGEVLWVDLDGCRYTRSFLDRPKP
ncbi:serine hydrolase domain-containing protein [Yinghuangia soli]|uniref:Beta-lactamase n=1 Tax=Yinghuangia soli TaxID=2908204 RepID=A0AA41Q7H7_9ACTN|nr:serine hydrolase domain-containing protein [Yinghuangia soli]MCF2533013.1 beta-lactamase family protein [Yinghuangia soli]